MREKEREGTERPEGGWGSKKGTGGRMVKSEGGGQGMRLLSR